jgi:hypothetical protein
MPALIRKAEKEGRVTPDTQGEALARWRADHGLAEDPHDQSGLNKQESERR